MRFSVQAATAAAIWSAIVAADVPGAPDWLGGSCSKELAAFAKKLSPSALIYFPGSDGFNAASIRWSNLETPKVDMVVSPGTEKDVSETIKFANSKEVPFLAFNTAHGALTTLGRMTHGIEIFLDQLSGVKVSEDGKTATIGGGTGSKVVTDSLWDAGKQTVTGTCECVSYLGPLLGGGHGWLQGHHGLIADQVVSFNIVLADGTLQTVTADSDLWWALKGAGHNFGVITSVTSKVYDIVHTDWAIETIVFNGDRVEEVYDAINKYHLRNGSQPVDLINWSYWFNNPNVDPEGPIIEVYIIQEGVTAVDPQYTTPFHALEPLDIRPDNGTYHDLGRWVGIALDNFPCQKIGLNNPRFPIYTKSYDPAAMRRVYERYKEATLSEPAFFDSLFMFEGYSNAGVRAIDAASTAFAYRDDNLLFAPLISYKSTGPELDAKAGALGNELRQILHEGTGRDELHAYVNYAFGDEQPEVWYGHEQWRQEKLLGLKSKYDPEGKFSFYAPVV
ncbi:FAD binding domain-containing protein [Plectosphaerella plurivora]|uniref:FAD binding domain-containing protein n=1 Tax=Plectosphaerella plurivora TaxID=936078 RepID=A0A9P8VJU4_9PEZI|nr:FAD binding domain-containing protein [Plectosphaerella plurivora]